MTKQYMQKRESFLENKTHNSDHRIRLKECGKKDKYLDLARELKKTMEHEGDNNTNCDWCFWHSN